MSLEKWLKPEKKGVKGEEKRSKTGGKKKNQVNSDSTIVNLELDTSKAIKVTRFKLECPKSTCKYKKTIIKKSLMEEDKICPRCKSNMKIK